MRKYYRIKRTGRLWRRPMAQAIDALLRLPRRRRRLTVH